MGFIGHTRFSLLNPHSPNWLASNGSRFRTPEEYQDYLYSPERLDIRCEIFFDLSLPQLQRSSEGLDYRHIVSYSDTLPAPYQERLENAERDFDFLVLDRHSGGASTNSLRTVASGMYGPNGSAGGPGTPFGLFRLDDDDLVSADYFQQMSTYITSANVGMQVSLGTGVTALFDGGRFYNPRVCHHPMLAIGLTSICTFSEDGTLLRPVDAPHNRSDRFNPVILDSRSISYLWVRHGTQDTSLRGAEKDPAEELTGTLQDMARFPRLQSLTEVEQSFPLGATRFSNAPSPHLESIVTGPEVPALDEQGIRVDTNSAGGVLQLELTLDCGAGTVPGNALVGLSLVDATGTPLEPEAKREVLGKIGLLFSPVPGIGHYRYVNTKAGQSEYSMTFNLPDGIFCRSFLIRRWNNSDLAIRVTRCEIFGPKGGTKSAASGSKVFIWGSCVTRDPFELESNIELVDYRARQSLGSAFAGRPLEWEKHLNLAGLTSPFQRRMVTSDVGKTLRDDLRGTEFDALILDFVDERMSTVDFNGSVVTDSPELEAAGFTAEAESKHEPWTDEGWARRKAGIAALLDVVDPERIIVNRVYWATTDDTGETFVQARWIAKNNAFLHELYAIFEAVPGIRFIDYPDELMVADSEHRWGRQPYHYVQAVNLHFLRELKTLLTAR